MSGYTLYRQYGTWHLNVYTNGHLVWTQDFNSKARAHLTAWWLRVRGIKPL